MAKLISILILGVLVWLWISHLRIREAAIELGRQACRRMDLQFLDDTVALDKLGLRRDKSGRVQIYRQYRFEFVSRCDGQHDGYVAFLGGQVAELHIDLHNPLQPPAN